MIGFALVIAAIIIMTEPNYPLIAWVITFTWFTLAVIALFTPKYSYWCAKSWVLISLPLTPILIISNGIIPATLIPLATIFSVMLVKHYWRLFAVIIVASSTLLVPFADVPYENAIWLRLCISNAVVAIMVLTLVSFLEQALVESMDKSDEVNKALIREREANQTQSKFLATMSHEIRTPMNGILGLLDVMLSTEVSEEQLSSSENSDTIVASHTELFIKDKIAPRLISTHGKLIVLTGYLVLTLLCLLRLQHVRVYFSFDLLINEDYKSYEYVKKKEQYFGTSYKPATYIKRANLEEDAEVT